MTTFSTAIGQIQALNVGCFGRAGDTGGTDYWVGLAASGAIGGGMRKRGEANV